MLVSKKLNEMGYFAERKVVTKNGVDLEAWVVGPAENSEIRAVFYCDGYIDSSVDEIVDRISNYIDNDKIADTMNNSVSDIMSFDYCKDKIILCARPFKKETPYTKRFMDMELYVRLVVNSDDEHGVQSAAVEAGLVETWEKSFDEIFEIARENTANRYTCESMMEHLFHMEPRDDDFMFIISNDIDAYGAGIIENNDVLYELYERFGDYFLIPSSIHELILIKDNGENPISLNEMVKDMNNTILDATEVLSNRVYKYCGADEMLIGM